MPNQPDENLDQPTYYPPQSPPLDVAKAAWESAIRDAIGWCDNYDQSIGSGTTDMAEMAGEAYEILRRLIAGISERGL